MIARVIIIALTLAACTPLSDAAKRLTYADICANLPETRAMIRELLVTEPGMVDLACMMIGK